MNILKRYVTTPMFPYFHKSIMKIDYAIESVGNVCHTLIHG